MEEKKDQTGQQGSQEEQKFKIKVQGQEKEVPLNELLELAQKGDDYTQKTQALAEEKKKMEEETQRKAEELAEQYLTNLAEEQDKEPPKTQESLDPQEARIAKLEKEIANMKGSTEETKVAQLRLQFEKQLVECKTKYPLLDEKVVVATLHANPKLDMEQVAKDSHESKEKERDGWIKDYLKDKGKQPKEAGGGTPPSPPTKEYTGQDLEKGTVKRAAAEFIRQKE